MHFLLQLLQFSIYVRSTSNVEFKRQRLKKIYSDYFSQPGANSFYAQLVANYINLLGKKFVLFQLQPSNKKSNHPQSSKYRSSTPPTPAPSWTDRSWKRSTMRAAATSGATPPPPRFSPPRAPSSWRKRTPLARPSSSGSR